MTANRILNGRYRVLRPIGRGGMGSVYLATHLGMGRHVAVKMLPAELVANPSYVERFRREARVAATLEHPHIVRAYDFDQDGDTFYLIMEFVNGPNLAALVNKRTQPLPVETVIRWISQAAHALHHAHQRHIVHRDVKPSNLLVTKEGDIKLLDLGLARHVDADDGGLTIANQERVMGTVDYLAPEQALDSHAADARADIYSLGCTLYFALTGQPPFAEGTIGQRIAQHQRTVPRSPRHLRVDVPQTLDAICMRMLAKEPAQRYQTAAEVAVELEALAPGRSTPHHLPDQSLDPHDTQLDSELVSHELTRFDPLSTAPLSSRIGRSQRTRRPPVLLWLTIAGLALVAAVLAWIVQQRGW